ncbi:transposase [Escherichia coli]|nr:transposase [Escherichia coli]
MIDVLGPEKRRRRTTQEKIVITQQSSEPGMTVSIIVRQHSVATSQLSCWRKQYQEGSLTSVAVGEQIVPVSELAAAMVQVRARKRWRVNSSKKPLNMDVQKVDSTRPFIAREWGISFVSYCLCMDVRSSMPFSDEPTTGRMVAVCRTDDTAVLLP